MLNLSAPATKILLTALAFYSLTTTTKALAEQAKQANKLVDAAGMNTHFGYNNSAYFGRTYEGRPVETILKDRLIELGVRHIRDNLAEGHHHNFLNELAGVRTPLQPEGIRTIAIARNSENIPIDEIVSREVAQAKSLFSQSNQPLEVFEVRNEQDTYEEKDLTARIVLLQKAFYESIKRDAQMSNLPILGPSFAQTLGGPVGDDSPILVQATALEIDLSQYIDIGNLHNYPGGFDGTSEICPPEILCAFTDRPRRHTEAIDMYRRLSGNKPFYTTETGYSQDSPAEGPKLTEAEIARMVPRTLAEYFDMGIQRVYFYQLAAEGENFHFLNSDYSPRQQFIALRNTLRLLNDPGPDFTPKELDYSLSGKTQDVHSVLLQKRSGKFYLLLWQAIGRANNEESIGNPRRKVIVKLNQEQFSSIKVYEPTFDSDAISPTIKDEATDGSEIIVSVPDHLTVLEITLN